MAGELSRRAVDIASRGAARNARILARVADAYQIPGPELTEQEELLGLIFQKFDSGEAHPVLAQVAAQIAQQMIAQQQQAQQPQ